MKKKTVSGATALAVLAAATIPVYAAPVVNVEDTDMQNPLADNDGGNDTPSITKLANDVEKDVIQPQVEDIVSNEEGWIKTTTLAQVDQLWDYKINEDDKTVTLKKFKGGIAKSDEVKVEIPREVEGYKVVLANLNNEIFEGVTHIRVAEGEDKVKLLATDIHHGFLNNETLKHVDLEGLDVSDVTDMTMLFSGCNNLQVINLLGWDIQESTITTAMFYVGRDATDEQKKILVISDSYRIRNYSFEQSNRLPYIVRFSANGGYFFDKEDDILNMTFGHYVIETDSIEELGYLYDIYVELAGEPTLEGHEFKGWYTEDKPTNVYELLSMTYKAKWAKVTEENPTPEQPPTEAPTPVPPVVEEEEGEVVPPTEEEEEVAPPTEENPTPEQPPVEAPTPVPPVVEEEEEEEVVPPTEETQPEAPNRIENLELLDKELQEKVDSIIAESVVQEQGLSLSITGDNEDIQHVKQVEITPEGIFVNVDGQELKFVNSLEGLELDLTNARAVRVVDEGQRAVTYKAVPYQATEKGLKVSSSNLENILITSKVAEPFVDVDDADWFKVDVEEALNYGFTTGTTPTTYNPYADITRAQFAVMIARALELTPKDSTIELADIEGKWYQNEAQALYEAGIIKGFNDGTFGGEKKLTRQQAATMMANMLKYTGVDIEVTEDVQFADMDKIGEHAQDAVKFLALNGVLVNGENIKFNPYNNLTRAQMAKMLVRSLRLTDLY